MYIISEKPFTEIIIVLVHCYFRYCLANSEYEISVIMICRPKARDFLDYQHKPTGECFTALSELGLFLQCFIFMDENISHSMI